MGIVVAHRVGHVAGAHGGGGQQLLGPGDAGGGEVLGEGHAHLLGEHRAEVVVGQRNVAGHVVQGDVGIGVVLRDEGPGLADHAAVARRLLAVAVEDGAAQHVAAQGQHLVHVEQAALGAEGLGDDLLRLALAVYDDAGRGQHHLHEEVVRHHHGLRRRAAQPLHVPLQDAVHVGGGGVLQLLRDGSRVQIRQRQLRLPGDVQRAHDAPGIVLRLAGLQLLHDRPRVAQRGGDVRKALHVRADGHQELYIRAALHVVAGRLGQTVGALLQIGGVVAQHQQRKAAEAPAQVGRAAAALRQALQHALGAEHGLLGVRLRRGVQQHHQIVVRQQVHLHGARAL